VWHDRGHLPRTTGAWIAWAAIGVAVVFVLLGTLIMSLSNKSSSYHDPAYDKAQACEAQWQSQKLDQEHLGQTHDGFIQLCLDN
jgi:hypothetical protein